MRKIISTRINKIHNFAAQKLKPQYEKLSPSDWNVKQGRKNLCKFLEGAINGKKDSQRELMKIVLLAHAELLNIDLKFYTWIKLLFMGDLKSEGKSLIEIYGGEEPGGEEPVFKNAMARIKEALVASRLVIRLSTEGLTEGEVKTIEEIKKALSDTIKVGGPVFNRLDFREPRYNRKEYWDRSLKQVQLIRQFFGHYRIFESNVLLDYYLGYFAIHSSTYEKSDGGSLKPEFTCTVTTRQGEKYVETEKVDVLDLIQFIWEGGSLGSLLGELVDINNVIFEPIPENDLALMINGLNNIYRATFRNLMASLDPDLTTFSFRVMDQLGVEIVKGSIRKKNIEELDLVIGSL